MVLFVGDSVSLLVLVVVVGMNVAVWCLRCNGWVMTLNSRYNSAACVVALSLCLSLSLSLRSSINSKL